VAQQAARLAGTIGRAEPPALQAGDGYGKSGRQHTRKKQATKKMFLLLKIINNGEDVCRYRTVGGIYLICTRPRLENDNRFPGFIAILYGRYW
jgi:hypothetical protein